MAKNKETLFDVMAQKHPEFSPKSLGVGEPAAVTFEPLVCAMARYYRQYLSHYFNVVQPKEPLTMFYMGHEQETYYSGFLFADEALEDLEITGEEKGLDCSSEMGRRLNVPNMEVTYEQERETFLEDYGDDYEEDDWIYGWQQVEERLILVACIIVMHAFQTQRIILPFEVADDCKFQVFHDLDDVHQAPLCNDLTVKALSNALPDDYINERLPSLFSNPDTFRWLNYMAAQDGKLSTQTIVDMNKKSRSSVLDLVGLV